MTARLKSLEIFELKMAIELVFKEDYYHPLILKVSSKNGSEEE